MKRRIEEMLSLAGAASRYFSHYSSVRKPLVAPEVHHVVTRGLGLRFSTAWWRSVPRAMPKRMPPTGGAGW